MGRKRLHCLAERLKRRPQMESLEARTLLSTGASPKISIAASPKPTGAPAASISGTNVDQIVGASQTRTSYGVDGSGMTVAVIDTGVNYNHEALGGGFGPGHKVIAGYDFGDDDSDPGPATPHGTAVAGLIASRDTTHPGIAPGADIVALRVFSNDGQSSFNRVADALQWVIDHHSQYNITAVNISLSDGNNYSHDWFANDGGVGQRVSTLVAQLDTLNIPVITADGNSYNGQQGVGFPAILPQTIDVTATDASDHIVANAQRLGAAIGGASATDIAAPGAGDIAPDGGGGFTTGDGTSFAAPIVTGAVVLLQEIYVSRFGHLPAVSDLKNWLNQGSDPVNDPSTGITIGRLNIPKAAAQIPGSSTPAPQVLAPAPPPAPTPPPPPPSQPAAPPSQTPANPPSTPTQSPGTALFVNGRPVSSDSSGQLPSAWSRLLALFSGFFQSFHFWGPETSQSDVGEITGLTRIQYWGPSGQDLDLGSAHPTGELAGHTLPTGPLHYHLHRSGLVRRPRHR